MLDGGLPLKMIWMLILEVVVLFLGCYASGLYASPGLMRMSFVDFMLYRMVITLSFSVILLAH